jgi:hypothetical protein
MSEGKRQLRRPRSKWKYNIKMDRRKIGLKVLDWFHMVLSRVQQRDFVNTVMNGRIP